jgi:ABC-type sugar transport system ATPase subunit
MDEPTSSLTLTEVAELFRLVRRLRADGTAIVFISHRLEELFEIADRVSLSTTASDSVITSRVKAGFLEQKALSYAIDQGYIMPDETLEHWPLNQVPTSKAELGALKTAIVQS